MHMAATYCTRFLSRYGREFRYLHAGSQCTATGRLSEVRTGARLVAAGGFSFMHSGNVFELLLPGDASAGNGDIVDDVLEQERQQAQVSYLLYSTVTHLVLDQPTHKHFFALRVNVRGLRIERLAMTPGSMGGVTKAVSATPVATDVAGHYWESDEAVRNADGVRSGSCDAWLVLPALTALREQDQVTVFGKRFEIAGYDAAALAGVLVCRLGRVK